MAKGVNTNIDSANVYVEAFDYLNVNGSIGSVLTLQAVSTGTFNGNDVFNTTHKGGTFYINFTQITATCTVRLNLLAKDNLSLNYVVIATVSMDGLSAGNASQNPLWAWRIYPGLQSDTAQGGPAGQQGQAQEFHNNDFFPGTMQVQGSVTTIGNAAVSMTVGLNKTL